MLRHEHYKAAEDLLARANAAQSISQRDEHRAQALVHATLALATKEVEKLANE